MSMPNPRLSRIVWERWLAIDRRLTDTRRPAPTLQDLLAHLHSHDFAVSQRTLEADLAAIREHAQDAGSNLLFDRKAKSYRYATPAFSLASIPLSAAHLEALQWAEALLHHMPAPLLAPLSDAVRLTFAALRVRQNVALAACIRTEPQGNKGLVHLPIILEALTAKRMLQISYRAFDSPIVNRSVQPLQLREFNGLWYLVSRHTGTTKLVVYALDRLESVVVQLDAAPDGYVDVDSYFQYTVGITVVANGKPPQKPVQFTVKEQQAKYLRILPLHPSQQEVVSDKRSATFEIYVHWNHELKMKLLSFGDQLIAPRMNDLILT